MTVLTQYLSSIGLWPQARLSAPDSEKIKAALSEATHEANSLADELEDIDARADDPFAVFAHRARRSQFRRRIQRGDA